MLVKLLSRSCLCCFNATIRKNHVSSKGQFAESMCAAFTHRGNKFFCKTQLTIKNNVGGSNFYILYRIFLFNMHFKKLSFFIFSGLVLKFYNFFDKKAKKYMMLICKKQGCELELKRLGVFCRTQTQTRKKVDRL